MRNEARSPHSNHVGTVGRCLAAVGFIAASLTMVTLPDAVRADTVPVVGKLPRFPADSVAALGDRIKPPNTADPRNLGGTLVSVPSRNELWQLYFTGSGDSPVAVAIRDASSLALLRKFDLPSNIFRSTTTAFGGDWIHAIDGDRRIFFIGNGQHPTTRQTIPSLIEVDLRTLATRVFPLGPPIAATAARIPFLGPAGIEYDPFDNAVIMAWSGIPNAGPGANFVSFLVRVDLRPGSAGTMSSRVVRSCNGPMPPTEQGRTTQVAGLITKEYVYWGCQRAGSIGAVVRIERSQLGDAESTEDLVAGPAYLEAVLADPAAGRLFLVTIAGEIWAFDTASMAFVGVISGNVDGVLRPSVSFGLDTNTGRLFFMSPVLGLGIAEGRFYPIPQARIHPALKVDGQERIISVTDTGRIFVLPGTQANRADSYTIYDVGDAPTPPRPPDPDANTTNVAEDPGVTDARFFANGTGYGVRTLLAKGISAAPPTPGAGQQTPTAEVISKNINSKCGFNDRELIAGRVAKAEYDSGSTAAQAVGIEVDERTKLDLEHLSRCDVTVRNGNEVFAGIFSTEPVGTKARENEPGVPWEREPAYCTSSAGGESTGEPASKNEGNSSGKVDCPQPGGKLTAKAIGYLTGAVTVGRAETSTEIARDSKGIVSTVISEAQDVDIAGVIQFGRIKATAVSRSNGRPSEKPMSTYNVLVEGVRIDGQAVCTNNCELKQVMVALNTAAAGRVEFRSASGLDERLLKGTPKGALTAVQKATTRQASDQALVGDSTTEVAGIEMTIYNDNTHFGRARQIFQFAGVSTAATYNIVRLPNGAGFDDELGGGDGGTFDEGMFSPAGSDGGAFLPGVSSLTGGQTVASVDDDGKGGPLRRALAALGRGIRMFFANPRHSLLLLTAWALFSLPAVLSRRRRLLTAARNS